MDYFDDFDLYTQCEEVYDYDDLERWESIENAEPKEEN